MVLLSLRHVSPHIGVLRRENEVDDIWMIAGRYLDDIRMQTEGQVDDYNSSG